jgi:hypothetical protein
MFSWITGGGHGHAHDGAAGDHGHAHGEHGHDHGHGHGHGHAEPASEEEAAAAVAALRAAVAPHVTTPEDVAFATDAALRRFLVARRWDVGGAAKTLAATLEWRKAHIRHPLRCEPCEADPLAHCVVPLGWDTQAHPVVWGCPARGANGDGPAASAHMVASLEHVFSLPQSGEQWVWCVDFAGFGLRESAQVNIAVAFAKVLPHHYPERLHKIVMLNRPYLFDFLMAAMKPFLDARTLGKLVSVRGGPDEVASALVGEHHFTAEMADWVAAAMRMHPRHDAPSVPPLPPGAAALQLPSLVEAAPLADVPLSSAGDAPAAAGAGSSSDSSNGASAAAAVDGDAHR